MGGRNYNHSLGAAVFGYSSGFPSATEIRMAEAIARARCARGEHRTETDEETGDEVCRWCESVVS